MTGDEYVRLVLTRYEVPRGPSSPAERAGVVAAGPIRLWAGSQLSGLSISGSYAKETGVKGASDIDLFVSLKSDTNGTLKGLYTSLFGVAQKHGWAPRIQNVSIGTVISGSRVDLVPARIQSGYQNYHSLYVSKRDSWTQTNVALHIDTVRLSSRRDEIRALKIWRQLNGLDFPSLHLELFVIQALSGRPKAALADNVLRALGAIATGLASTRIVDPGNKANVISDDLTKAQKEVISTAAAQSASEGQWASIIW